MKLIACSHPGKMGDALWALPTVRALCERHGAQCDFYTSEYCRPMKSLVEAQGYIRQMIVPAAYEVKSMDCGVQPWEMPIDARGYEAVYQLGFRGCPQGVLGAEIAATAGLPPEAGLRVRYDHVPVWLEAGAFANGYVVIASRGETSYAERFREMARRSPLPCVEVGAEGQRVIPASLNRCGTSVLQMASIIAGARAFVGLMSGPLVIANGWEMPKIIPHNGVNWDMRHVLRTPQHHYLVEPAVEQMINLIPTA